jgi:hypothetical protein
MKLARLARLISALAIIGCGGKDPANPGGGGDDEPEVDAAVEGFVPPAGYTRLVGRTWSASVGENLYKCVRVTVPQDLYITNIIAQAPNGTHHSVLSIAGANGTAGPDGEHECGATNIGMLMVYASSVGTAPLDFPAGVGIKLDAGEQLHLNLHLFNTSDDALTGETAIWVKAAATPTPTLAEMVLAGPIDMQIPADGQPYSASGTCTATTPYTLFAVWPHMHKLGTQQKVEHVRGSSATVLHDKPFVFEEQSYFMMSPMAQVATGEQIRVTCTYVNTTGAVVTYGDGADKEMCFSGLYRFPASGSNEYCPE